MATLVPQPLQRFRRLVERRQPAGEQDAPSQARQNIHRHYDLSNDLFAAFLDETLSYSAAMFEAGDDLARAQRRKVDAVLDLAAVGPGCSMLEIGTGWASSPSRPRSAAPASPPSRCRASNSDLALRRAAEAGVSDHVRILLADYRESDR